jgi:serine protease
MLKKALAAGVALPVLMLSLSAGSVTAMANHRSVEIETMPTLHYASGHQSPARTRTTNLTYHGGQVETTPKIYIDFWGSWWNTPTTTGTDGSYSFTNAQAMSYVQSFFSNVGGSAWDGINTQYCQGVASGTINCGTSGTHVTNPTGQLVATMIDSTNAVPTSPTQNQIAAEATYAAGKFGLAGASQAGTTVFVFTPAGNSMSGFGTQWCAWHSVTSYSGSNLPYAYMPYQPSAGTSCGENFVNAATSFGNGYFDGFSVVGGHEYAEAATDPITVNGSLAWTDSSGNEIGDKCAWSTLSSNISLAGNNYAVQPLWSNTVSGCALH